MEAYAEGYKAAENKLPLTYNPYPEEDARHEEWKRGWFDYKP